MEKLRTCFFTGHRRLPAGKVDIIKKVLSENIERLISEYDVKNFISGGAIGFDQIAAEAVVKLREKYPKIKLFMYLPCYGQSKKWNFNQKYKYRMILSQADEIVYVTEEEYRDGCMQLRNMEMIKASFFCISFCVIAKSGTGYTMKSAAETGAQVINIADEIYEG